MAIEVHCDSCNKTMRVKDSLAGTRGLCPYCNAEIAVPNRTGEPTTIRKKATKKAESDKLPEEPKPPTEKQIDYARILGINFPENVTRLELSRMIDEALDDAPASEGQKEFLRDLGVEVPDNIKSKQMSILLDTALDLKTKVQERYDQQMKESGYFMDSATVQQLLNELQNRGKPFFIFTLENDEFRYQEKLPISGQLRWTHDLNPADVQYILLKLTSSWAKKLNLTRYAEEFDNDPPKVEFDAAELEDEDVTTVHLNLNPPE